MSTSAAAPSPVSILKKSSKSSSSSASALNPPTKTPSSSLTAEARLLESQLPLPPKKERKPKRPRVEVTDSTGAAKPSSKRAKKDEVEDLPVVEGKKAEKKRLRAEAQAARPPLPPVEKTPLVWDTEKNGRNPYEDERLSEAAKKAIGYSQTIQNPYLKFQKARQNFLLRHIYNENEIPSNYLPLVLAYLKTVKGGSRDSLVASANLILNPPPKPEPTPIVDVSASATTAEEATTDAAPVTEEVVEEKEEETEEEKEVKRSRAKSLLEVLEESGEKKEKKSKKSKKVEEVVEEEKVVEE